MSPEKIADEEALGRKIAAALAGLGLSRAEIQTMIYFSVDVDESPCAPSQKYRERATRAMATHNVMRNSRCAGAALHFEKQGK